MTKSWNTKCRIYEKQSKLCLTMCWVKFLYNYFNDFFAGGNKIFGSNMYRY